MTGPKVAAGAVVVLLVVAGLAGAAGADHQWLAPGSGPPHWRPDQWGPYGQHKPWVSAAGSPIWPNAQADLWPFTSAAETRWTSYGNFSQGFVTGAAAPSVACPPAPAGGSPYVVGPGNLANICGTVASSSVGRTGATLISIEIPAIRRPTSTA